MGPAKQLTSVTRKSALFVPEETIDETVSGFTVSRLVTVTVTGADVFGKPPILPKSMEVGVIDIPITFPSSENEADEPVTGPWMVTVVTGVPMTGMGEMPFPM
jgi:hypothetical protein